jgi:predicted metal-binding membrane protein
MTDQPQHRTSVGGNEVTPQAVFIAICALAFAASVAGAVYFCRSMSGRMEMPGGWTMSMTWMRMPGQSWASAAAMFLLMWLTMMVAMMLPSLVPTLRRYRQAVGRTGETRLGRLTALVGAGYFFVWTVFGAIAFAVGATLASIEMRQPTLAYAVPVAAGIVVLVAGAIQFTTWKENCLACCRDAHLRSCALTPDAGTACWRHRSRTAATREKRL